MPMYTFTCKLNKINLLSWTHKLSSRSLNLGYLHQCFEKHYTLLSVCEVFRKKNMITCYHDNMITLS
jgi:hypothetical protein